MARPLHIQGADMATKTSGIKCLVLRDYWDAAGDRVRAGSIVNVPVDAALDGVEVGNLSRVKDADK